MRRLLAILCLLAAPAGAQTKAFTGLTLYATHVRTAPKRNLA